jgi:predicted nucleic acid-binding protein
MAKFNAVFNTSPLIFLTKLEYIDNVFSLFDECYVPDGVLKEINKKNDEVKTKLENFLTSNKIIKKQISHWKLFKKLNKYIDVGESQAITLGVEIEPNFIVLDDNAARRLARRVGLEVIGSLGLIKYLIDSGKIDVNDLNVLYNRLKTINFRISQRIFDAIFF